MKIYTIEPSHAHIYQTRVKASGSDSTLGHCDLEISTAEKIFVVQSQ